VQIRHHLGWLLVYLAGTSLKCASRSFRFGGFRMKVLLVALWVAALSSTAFAADPTIDNLLDRARVLRQSGHPAEAKPLAEHALALAEKSQAWAQLVQARQEVSFEERLAGNYDRVLQLRLANLNTVRAHHDAFPNELSDEEEEQIAHVGAAYSWKRNYELAVRYCREDVAASEAFGQRSKGGGGTLLPHALQRLGINLYLWGHFAEAEGPLRDAYDGYVAFAKQVQNQTQASWYYENQVEVLRWLERDLVAQNRVEEALEVAERGRARALAATLAGRTPGGDHEPTGLALNEARAIVREHGVTVVEYSLLYAYDPDMLFVFSNFEDVPIELIHAWVIQPNGKITFRETALPRDSLPLVQMVKQARSSIGAYGRNLTVDPEPHVANAQPLRDLYDLLIAPIKDDLPHDPGQVVTFVPQDWLFMVPFAALKDGSSHYLIEQHAISEVPSLEILNLTHKEITSPRNGKGALVVGNPLMPSFISDSGGIAQKLNQLPGAEQEAKAVAARFRATPLIGPAATKDQVLRRLPNARIVHLATHGLLDQTTGGFQSALAFAPDADDNGFLSMHELQNMKLNADLVVLSACDTALGKMSGDGILGLSRSLMTAGIPSVIVSLWAISDESTAYLMDHFYAQLEQGQDKARSLQTAMLETSKRYPAPLNWAAFVLIGETTIIPGSHRIQGDPDPLSMEEMEASNFALPLPRSIHDLREDPDPAFGGATSSITFETQLTATELVSFYKQALERRGLRAVPRPEEPMSTSFTLVYRGPWGDREAVVQGSRTANETFVSTRFEVRRDDDAEFPAAINEKRAGLLIPAHAIGLQVNTRFDSSAAVGDVTFLSTMAPGELRDMYRTVFQKIGFTEDSNREEKQGEKIDSEFRGQAKGRALRLHIETSFSHPDRREVRIQFENLSH
jgi:CHAT domain-containing protein